MTFRFDLDQDHYGLQKLKKRVIEYLSVRKLKNSLKGKLVLFAIRLSFMAQNQHMEKVHVVF